MATTTLTATVVPEQAPPARTVPTRLLVIDAERACTLPLANRSQAAGWQVEVVPTSPDPTALQADAVIIDPAACTHALPDYLAVASRQCRAVIILSAPSSVAERVQGLRLGADGWVTKPCHPEELLALVEGILRRRSATEATSQQSLVAAELEIRTDRYDAFVAQRPAELTRREFELLCLLARAGGGVLEREAIYRGVWGYQMVHGDRSVDVFIRKIRQKLERLSPDWRYIHTQVGAGYRFAAQPAGDRSPRP